MQLSVHVVLWRPRSYRAMCQVVGVRFRKSEAEELIEIDQKYVRLPPREREDYEIHEANLS